MANCSLVGDRVLKTNVPSHRHTKITIDVSPSLVSK